MIAARHAETDHARAVAEAFRTHAGLVERVLRRAGVPERDLGDLRQEVFLVVHRRLAQFEGRSSLSTWLYRIALNVASDHLRRAYQRRERLADPDDGHERDGRAGSPHGASDELAASDPLASAEQQQLLAHVLRALEQLDCDKREAFVLSELYELPMREVASRLGCPAKTAFSRTYAARRRILAELHKAGALSGLPLFLPLRALRALKLGASAARVALVPAHALAPFGWLASGAAACALALALAFMHLPAPVRGRSLAALGPEASHGSAAGPIAAAGTARGTTVVSAVGAGRATLRAAAASRVHMLHAARSYVPAPRAFAPALLASEPAPSASTAATQGDLQVVRSGALDLRPVLSSPLAASLPQPAAAPARIRVRGPGDPADGVESALSSSGP